MFIEKQQGGPMTPERRERLRAHHRLRRARLIADAMCCDCGRESSQPTNKRCPLCAQKRIQYSRRHRTKSGTGRGEYARSIGGSTFDDIAIELGVSRQRAEQIYHRAIDKLRRACRRHGIDGSAAIGAAESMLARAEIWA